MDSLHLILSTLILIITVNFNYVQSSNILFVHMAATSSHRTSIWPLAEKLADRGHNVTYIFGIEQKIGYHPKIEEITPKKLVETNLRNHVAAMDINLRINNTLYKLYQRAFSLCFEMCRAFYESEEIKDWLSRPQLKYDLILMDSTFGECIYGLVHKFKAKHVIFVPAIVPYHWDAFGMAPPSNSIPPTLTILGTPPKQMDFWGRIRSTVEPLIWRLGYLDYAQKVKYFMEDVMNVTRFPELGEFDRNTSLVLVNNHFVEDYPMALPPLFVSYSGLWCSREKLALQKALPDKLAKFVEDSNSDGFVYVSFGSSVVASGMPVELRDKFFGAFEQFPTLRFLWRWTGAIPENRPKNVWLQSWFPQHDVLGHPKIRGFISQCGRPSTQEALCYGVPMITIPIFAEQDYNADRMGAIGAAINLDIGNITNENLVDAINELVYTEKYKKRMTELSTMFKDRLVDPLDSAVYWTEYVLRHDTSLLRPLGMDQTWYQRRLLDVYLVLGALFLAAIFASGGLIFFMGKCAMRLLFGGSSKPKID